MKMKIKVNELINILIQKDEDPLLKKYKLTREKVLRIQNSLKEGDWKFVS